VRGVTKSRSNPVIPGRYTTPGQPRPALPPAARALPLGLLSLLLATGLAACAARPGPGWSSQREHYSLPTGDLREKAGEILSRAIQFDTRNPPGNEAPLAAYYVDLLQSAGLEAQVVPTPSGAAKERRAIAWARYPGTGKKRPIVLLSHMDVVPADRAEWTVGPFSGLIAGGTVVGRGALDAKGIGVVDLLTLIELRRRGIQLDRDVIFLATPDEETGGRFGSGLLVRDHRDLLDGAAYLLTEGGSILPRDDDRPEVWGISVTEKTPCWIGLRTQGVPGHGATPIGETAPERLVRALARLQSMDMPVRVVPAVARMFDTMAALSPPADRESYRNLRGALALNPEFRSRFLEDPGRSALVRDTLTLTVLRASHELNVVPAEAFAGLDGRLLPGEDCRPFVAKVRETIADPAVDLEVLLHFTDRASPVDTPLFRAIARVAQHQDPGAIVVPRVISGFTDSHYYRDLGLVAYGFVPRRLRPAETRGIHGPNEKITVDNLVYGVDTTIQILQALDAEDR
jgi:acetylornithine deacetylase/succinyl-diaminopimelate desuccinylase-like protein